MRYEEVNHILKPHLSLIISIIFLTRLRYLPKFHYPDRLLLLRNIDYQSSICPLLNN